MDIGAGCIAYITELAFPYPVTENDTIVKRYCQGSRQAGCYCGDGRDLRVAAEYNVAWLDAHRADPVKQSLGATKQLVLVGR